MRLSLALGVPVGDIVDWPADQVSAYLHVIAREGFQSDRLEALAASLLHCTMAANGGGSSKVPSIEALLSHREAWEGLDAGDDDGAEDVTESHQGLRRMFEKFNG